MANLITLIRLALLFIILGLMLAGSAELQLLNVVLLIFAILLDGLDGIVARARNEVTPFGSVFDIAVDRLLETLLWITFAHIHMIPFWVPIVVITRGILVDSLRNSSTGLGKTPFGMMKTTLGKALVSSRFMRCTYGALKGATFAWLLFMQPFPSLWPQLWAAHIHGLAVISGVLVYLTVLICLLRGIPVLLEIFLFQLRTRP